MSKFDQVTTELNEVLKRYNISGVMFVIGVVDENHIMEGGVLVQGDTNFIGTALSTAKMHDPKIGKVLKLATGRPDIMSSENLPN